MKDKLLILGASGHGKVVADIAIKMNRWQSISFLDDNEDIRTSLGLEVIGKTADAYKYIEDHDIFVGIGNNATREILMKKLESSGATIPVLIHPNAVVGEQVAIGSGTAIMAGAVVNCSTTIGKGCIINTGATVDHDNFIDDYVHISPGAHTAGSARIGKGTWLGIGSIVINNITIIDSCTIAAGACVINNVTEPGIYVGIPACRIFKGDNT
jgi:sugar O-acyltransferase (sialic acid O-acetyltransferase NeuD family)